MRFKAIGSGMLFIILITLSGPSCPGIAGDHIVRIAGDEEKKGGYLVEITQTAFQRAGYQPVFEFVPWARALARTSIGDYDVLLAAYYTEERAKKLAYSAPIGKAEVVLLKLKSQHITYSSLKDLSRFRIGHIRGSAVSSEFDAAEKAFLNIQYVSHPELNIKKLLHHRIDLVVEKKQRLIQLMSTTFVKEAAKLDFVSPPLKVNHFYNAFSRKKHQYRTRLNDFNKALQVITEDGTLAQILKRHGILDNYPAPSPKAPPSRF